MIISKYAGLDAVTKKLYNGHYTFEFTLPLYEWKPESLTGMLQELVQPLFDSVRAELSRDANDLGFPVNDDRFYEDMIEYASFLFVMFGTRETTDEFSNSSKLGMPDWSKGYYYSRPSSTYEALPAAFQQVDGAMELIGSNELSSFTPHFLGGSEPKFAVVKKIYFRVATIPFTFFPDDEKGMTFFQVAETPPLPTEDGAAPSAEPSEPVIAPVSVGAIVEIEKRKQREAAEADEKAAREMELSRIADMELQLNALKKREKELTEELEKMKYWQSMALARSQATRRMEEEAVLSEQKKKRAAKKRKARKVEAKKKTRKIVWIKPAKKKTKKPVKTIVIGKRKPAKKPFIIKKRKPTPKKTLTIKKRKPVIKKPTTKKGKKSWIEKKR